MVSHKRECFVPLLFCFSLGTDAAGFSRTKYVNQSFDTKPSWGLSFCCFYIKVRKLSIRQLEIVDDVETRVDELNKKYKIVVLPLFSNLFNCNYFLVVALRVIQAETRLTVYRRCQVGSHAAKQRIWQ